MSAYLAYSYSTNLTDEEKIKIDQQVEENRENFGKGFQKGMQISLSMYSIFLLLRSTSTPAYAADVPDSTPTPETCPELGPVVPAKPKPGMKPLGEGSKGAFVGGASAICGAALQSRDFLLGLACAFLLVIGGIVINRPPHD